jgi:hypothetical protein
LELNRRFMAGTALAALVALVPGMSAQAQVASPDCATSQSPSFVLGFAALKDQLADAMGDPIECEHANPQNGDTLQQTTRGLAFYRKSTNTPTFTNGSEHWAITGGGLVFWRGSSIDPLGTVASSNGSTGGSNTSTEATGATGQGSLTQPFPIGQPVAIDTIAADGTPRSFEITVLPFGVATKHFVCSKPLTSSMIRQDRGWNTYSFNFERVTRTERQMKLSMSTSTVSPRQVLTGCCEGRRP